MRSFSRCVVIALLATQSLACDDVPSAPEFGTLRVSTSTTGPDLDSDGYQIVIDGTQRLNIASNAELVHDQLPGGTHTLALEGVAGNCTVAGTQPLSVTIAPDTARVEFIVTCSRTNDRIAFAAEGWIAVTNLGTSEVTLLTEGDEPAWSPNGVSLAYSGLTCELMQGDDYYYQFFPFWVCTEGIRVLGPSPAGIPAGTNSPSAEGKGYSPSWSPDGKVLAFSLVRSVSQVGYSSELAITQEDGSAPVRLGTDGFREVHHPSWSPDGQRIVFSCIVENQDSEICVINRDGSGLRQLTIHSGIDENPSWSPDGSRIAFTTDRFTGERDVATMTPDGENVTRLLSGSDPAWSPDGSRLIVAQPSGLFVADADGSNVTRVTSGHHRAPVWRP